MFGLFLLFLSLIIYFEFCNKRRERIIMEALSRRNIREAEEKMFIQNLDLVFVKNCQLTPRTVFILKSYKTNSPEVAEHHVKIQIYEIKKQMAARIDYCERNGQISSKKPILFDYKLLNHYNDSHIYYFRIWLYQE